MTEAQKKIAAKKFAEKWKDAKGYEKGETQSFWNALLRDVYGAEHPEEVIEYEVQVKDETTNFIDGYIGSTRVVIEQKGSDIDLTKKYKQSDGSSLTPYQQAQKYAALLGSERYPKWIVVCNFREFHLHDMKQPSAKPKYIIQLSELENDFGLMNFLVNPKNEAQERQKEISVAAGKLVSKLYETLAARYDDPKSPETMRSLNILCVRLVFCLYADDAEIFGRVGMFHDYLKACDVHKMRLALHGLFKVLDQKPEERPKYLADDSPELAEFPYVNGGLFSEKDIDIPPFTEEIRDLLLNQVSGKWRWRDINPTIFGAVFESTLNPETRQSGGMHYTSVENIHKVIDPLFLDDLKAELAEISAIPNAKKSVPKEKKDKLSDFQTKLAGLSFLDPACGSGNFLTETYLSLRRLENEVLSILAKGQINITGFNIAKENYNPIQVQISQFHGIEINDFAVSVARTALWIAESQMMRETENIIKIPFEFLPLKTNANIREGNALKMDWEKVIPREKVDYIIGNPPFAGARLMNTEQKKDLSDVFLGWKNAGNLDYVCCWYKKSLELMKGTKARAALVSTNSVCQGESVSVLWKPLFEEGAHIDFAHRTFRWDNQASDMAHVHCVIVGFSTAPNDKQKIIYDDGVEIIAKNINAYLLDAENIFVESRNHPLCDVPEIGIGNKPIDGGNYLFTKKERDEFLKKEPAAEKYFKPWYGSDEFINSRPRYCLWLGNCPPNELRRMSECMKRVEAVKNYRLASKSPGTVKLANKPTRFHVENMPKGNYIIIPRVSSEKRRYIPIGFLPPDVFTSDSAHIIPDAALFHFGVLISNVHMAWTRAVCGRLETRYRYSKDIVYNNFPWPEPTEQQREKIEKTAQAILDARAKFPEASLADLYDEVVMPPELRSAHDANNRAVMEAYGFVSAGMNEAACVAELMKLYAAKTGSEK